MKLSYAGRRTRLLTGAATGLALLTFAGAAATQDVPETDEVVVTGIRASIENSIALKRNETSIVEVISAEDIGKLPDVSIAESLARLPGLTAQRLNGRAQVISIRGLAPDFTTALLNGREQVSAGDNRGVEFDQYPSELLSGVVVYKTPDAGLIGQGLAGTVDLRTVRPLAFGRRAIAVNARYEWNELGALNAGTDDTGERYSISYIDQFLDGRLGVALGYAHMTSPYQAERFNAWGYPSSGPGGALVIGGAKPYVQSSVLERDGYMGVLEFKPVDDLKMTLDVFYSEFQFEEILRGIELPLAWGGQQERFGGACTASGNTQTADCRPGPVLSNTTVVNGLVTAGTFSNVKGVVRNDANTRDSTLSSIGFNTEARVFDDWTVELDVSASKIDRTDVVLETYAGTGQGVAGALDTLGFTTSAGTGTRFRPTLNYADYNLIQLTSPQGWGSDVVPGGQVGYLNSPTTEDELRAIRLSLSRDLQTPVLSGFEVGVNVTGRDKSFRANEFFLGLPNGAATAAVPTQFRLGATPLDFLGIPGMISYDPLALVDSGFYVQTRNPNGDVAAKDWYVGETVTTGYLMAEIDSSAAGLPITGNVGLQIVDTEQRSSAFAATGSGNMTVTVPVFGGADYTEVLPSLNLIFQLPADQFVRFAAARTLARPRMDEMRASFTYGYDAGKASSTDVDNSPWGGGGGNPALEPWMARAFDVSYEKYFGGRRGYISLAAFYKDLESYIYNQRRLVSFAGFPVGAGNPEPVLRQGFVSSPANGEGGEIKGAEFTLNLPLDIVTEALDGFGVYVSASKTESEVEPNGPGSGVTPLPGLSEEVVNSSVYYEKNGFQARVSNRYRSDFLGEVAVFANGRGLRMVKGESVIDAQIGYEFQSGPLEGFSILLQGNNLTDEEFSTYQDSEDRVIDYQRYGRTFLLGVNYRF
jgi:iron complex outermembrane receptor protein